MQQCEADREQKCHTLTATRDTYRTFNQLRVAARGDLEWIRISEGPAVYFTNETSDLLYLKLGWDRLKL